MCSRLPRLLRSAFVLRWNRRGRPHLRTISGGAYGFEPDTFNRILAQRSTGTRDLLDGVQLARAVPDARAGPLVLDCCKTGGSSFSDENAFPTIFQKQSDWCVIHPFGWTAMTDSQVSTEELLVGLVEGHSLPSSVFRARKEILGRGGNGWWSTLLQGNLSSLSLFRLTNGTNTR